VQLLAILENAVVKNSSGPLRAVTYGRVSTQRQAERGISLGDQRETLAVVVKRRGWTHLAHFEDRGASGKKVSNRPRLVAALELLDAGDADVLVVAKTDRLARSTQDFATLLNRAARKGWKVLALDMDVDTTTAAGRMVAQMVAVVAEFESQRIGERVREVHAVRKAQGKRAGQPPLLPARTRRMIKRLREDGMSLRAIAAHLTEKGVPTARGGTWASATVLHVLRSLELDEELRRAS
jgi:DNA invertase Pin-like site-specific DNA recombinase